MWSPQLLALLVTSRQWNSKIRCWQVKTVTIKATGIAALVNEPPKRFLEIDKKLIVVNGDIFEHLGAEMICPTWLYEGKARADTLIRGSQTVVDNMYDVLDTETQQPPSGWTSARPEGTPPLLATNSRRPDARVSPP